MNNGDNPQGFTYKNERMVNDMRDEYIEKIIPLIKECNNIRILDIIFQLLIKIK